LKMLFWEEKNVKSAQLAKSTKVDFCQPSGYTRAERTQSFRKPLCQHRWLQAGGADVLHLVGGGIR
jgi:hypothetical protein